MIEMKVYLVYGASAYLMDGIYLSAMEKTLEKAKEEMARTLIYGIPASELGKRGKNLFKCKRIKKENVADINICGIYEVEI